MKIYRETPNLVKIGQKNVSLYMKTEVCFTLLAATYVVQLYGERIVVCLWRSFQYC
jgi:hypothetical protein